MFKSGNGVTPKSKESKAFMVCLILGILCVLAGSFGGGLFFLIIVLLLYYRQAARRRKFDRIISNAIVIDTETTGLSSEGKDELLEVSIIDLGGNVLFNHYVKPEHRKTWSKASEINGITPEMVKNEEPISSYLDELNRIFRDASCVIGYNTEFDLGFLRVAGVDCSKPYVDVMKDYGVFSGVYDSYHGHERYFKLSAAASHFGYDWGSTSAHDSLADAMATSFVFNSLRDKGYYKTHVSTVIRSL